MRPARHFLALGLVLALGTAAAATLPRDRFDHDKHAKLFPACETCHAGILDRTKAIWPEAQACASCHDGTVEKQITWTPPSASPPSNLRFTHAEHAEKARDRLPADSTYYCSACHLEADGKWMAVARTRSARCLDCHGVKRQEHVSAPDTACATCHLPLAEAVGVPLERVAKFEVPSSHRAAGFLTPKGHGEQARPPAGSGHQVAPSCATCHARDFCTQCHVNAPEVRLIQALAPDPRSTAIVAKVTAPASHRDSRFLRRHGARARNDIQQCASCHTQESCFACHKSGPAGAVAIRLATAGPGRGVGARVEPGKPGSHTLDFARSHGPVASATPGSCASCHARTQCLECHRPNAGSEGSYHAAGFVVRHPAAAFSRESDCAECHNAGSFCTSCHAQSGLTASGRALSGGYHDSRGAFLVGHGTAARQNLESCVSCHSERDCLACHSAQSRHFNPHGPGFDPERLRRRNPQVCAACHGRAIPRGDD